METASLSPWEITAKLPYVRRSAGNRGGEKMTPIFTIHAGEYLAGEKLEKRFPDCDVWVPSKDRGIDLLVTNKKDRHKSAALQIKLSKDYVPVQEPDVQQRYDSWGWWSFELTKIEENIKNTNPDFWILMIYSFAKKDIRCVIIKPAELRNRLVAIHGKEKPFKPYLWITKDNKCFETRSLKSAEKDRILEGDYSGIEGSKKDFTEYLDNWEPLEKLIA